MITRFLLSLLFVLLLSSVLSQDTLFGRVKFDSLEIVSITEKKPYRFVSPSQLIKEIDSIGISGVILDGSKSLGCGTFCSSGVLKVMDSNSGGIYFIIVPCLTSYTKGDLFDHVIFPYVQSIDSCYFKSILSTFQSEIYFYITTPRS